MAQNRTPSPHRMGRSFSDSHSSLWYAQMGCSEVAMRYFLSSPEFTLYSVSSNSESCATPAITSWFMKKGVCSGVYLRAVRKATP